MTHAFPDACIDTTAHSVPDVYPSTQESSVQFCAECHAFDLARQLDSVKYTTRRFCDKHRAERMRFSVYGTHDGKVANCMRAIANHDRRTFGQTHIKLSKKDIISLFSPEQSENYTEWVIIPRHPTQILSMSNATLVKKPTRSFLLCEWKQHKDPAGYTRKLEALITSLDVGF